MEFFTLGKNGTCKPSNELKFPCLTSPTIVERMLDKRWCFFDLETTGFYPDKDSIIEVAAWWIGGDQPSEKFSALIQPTRSPLNATVSYITHISQSMLDAEGQLWEPVQAMLSSKLANCVVVGHNIDFDLDFLRAHGVDLSTTERLDTHELARILLVNEPSYSLEILTERYGLAHHDAHRAMSDVEATQALWERVLLPKLAAWPNDLRQQLKPWLESQKAHWWPAQLFLEPPTSQFPDPPAPALPADLPPENLSPSLVSAVDSFLENPEPSPHYVRLGNIRTNRAFWQRVQSKNPSTLLVTPHWGLYRSLPVIPTPAVLFSAEKFQTLLQSPNTNPDQTVFLLKAAYRQFLGHRGKDFFDLFNQKETALWSAVSLDDPQDSDYQKLLAEKLTHPHTCISHFAFWYLLQNGWTPPQGCLVCIDEGELWLESGGLQIAQEWNLNPYLDDPLTATQGTFIFQRWIQQVVEPLTNGELGDFPRKIALPTDQTYPELAQELADFTNPHWESWIAALNTVDPETIRWIHYEPQRGKLSFCLWRQSDWETTKEKLANLPLLIGHRHCRSLAHDFFGLLDLPAGSAISLCGETQWKADPVNVALSSPEFSAEISAQVQALFESQPQGGVGVCIAGLELLRRVGLSLPAETPDLILEKLQGGDNKVRFLLAKTENPRCVVSRLMAPEFFAHHWSAVMIPKIPFPPPHPVWKHWETQHDHWWDLWVVPTTMARLSWAAERFPSVPQAVVLDPRLHARWAQNLWRQLVDPSPTGV